MSDPRFEHIGPLDIRVMEECAEVIFTITKAKRFGLNNIHPAYIRLTNKALIKAELKDCIKVCQEYLLELGKK